MTIPKTMVAQREDHSADTSGSSSDPTSSSNTPVAEPRSPESQPREKVIRWSLPNSPTSDTSTRTVAAPSVPREITSIVVESSRMDALPQALLLASEAERKRLLLEKMMRKRKHRKSPPPPAANTLADLQLQLNRMEKKIQRAASVELKLLNQAKALRGQRQILTKRYEVLSANVAELMRAENPNASMVQRSLPPLLKTGKSAHKPETSYVDLTTMEE